MKKVALVFALALAGAVVSGQADSEDSSSAQLLAQAPTQPAQSTPTPPKVQQTTPPAAASPADRRAWAETLHHTPAPREGCFQALYPSTQWQAVPCAPPPGWRSAPARKLNQKEGAHEQVGGGTALNNDIVVQAPSGHLLSVVEGSFRAVQGVTSETGVGVAAFGGGGFLGPNEYSLQINTNTIHSAACGSYSSCLAWQQYVFATNTTVSLTDPTPTNETQVFIEYWLFNYGTYIGNGANICPTGFLDNGPSVFGAPGDDCVQNSQATVIYNGQLPITDLADLTLTGTAQAGGVDNAIVTYGGTAYVASVTDSYTDIASVWNQAEFNVLGNAGGAEAQFNSGTSIIVQIAVTDGSESPPTCGFNGGSTGESNNLNFVPSTSSPVCCPYGGRNFHIAGNPSGIGQPPRLATVDLPQVTSVSPSIEFMEVYDTSHTYTASCGGTTEPGGSLTGGPIN